MSITLKAARSNKNMTQKELSERLGISEGTLRNYEKGITFPNAETIPYWQGSGTSYDFASTSAINIKHGAHEVEADGILAVMFDREALGVSNLDKRVTSQYNARGEFYNNWYKFDAGYFNDLNENFVVFYVA